MHAQQAQTQVRGRTQVRAPFQNNLRNIVEGERRSGVIFSFNAGYGTGVAKIHS